MTRVQKLKIKTLESLAKIRAGKATDGDSELIDDWIKAVEGVRMMTKTHEIFQKAYSSLQEKHKIVCMGKCSNSYRTNGKMMCFAI